MSGAPYRAFALVWMLGMLTLASLASAQDAGVVATDGGVANSGDSGSESSSSDAGSTPRRPAAKARPIPQDRLPRVEVRLGAEKVELGQVIPLEIAVHARPGDKIHLRETRRFGRFELIDRRRREGTPGEGPSETLELDLLSFRIGQLEIPAIELLVVLADGRTGSVSTEPLPLRITDPLGNENDPEPRADHAPRPVLTTDRRALWIGGILAALILAAILGAVIGRLRARRSPPPGPPPPPPRPPEEVALEKLDVARDSDWLEGGEIKLFHVAVSEALREYLGGRYGFDSLEMTTEELTGILEGIDIRGVSDRELQSFLRETDMVKFAKWRPDVGHSRELLERAYDIVSRTTAAELAHEIRPKAKKKAQVAKEAVAVRPEGGQEAGVAQEADAAQVAQEADAAQVAQEADAARREGGGDEAD